ncbi:MAG: ribosome silencing factor [Spirochaetes bacterium]|nr:ribosome silencing factor [Spirochaetota bacterium]
MEKIVHQLQTLIEEKQGDNLIIYDVSEVTTTTSYVFIVTANSVVHARSLANSIIDEINHSEWDSLLMSKKYDQNNPWILIDCSEMIFHIFQKEARDYYHLEKLYFRGVIINSQNQD